MSGKPFVSVLGSDGRPIMPCTGKRARLLLERGRAKVVKREPFVIQLLDRSQDNCELQPIHLKIDPGSRYTGIAIARQTEIVGEIQAVRLIELEHRGKVISMKLQQRAMYRKNRRSRNTRYRQPRFLNRTKPKGWLAPSLNHRIDTTMSWVNKLNKIYPVTSIHVESVKFDTHKLRYPEVYGEKYQKGELFRYNLKEYLLDHWDRKCAYCDTPNVTRFEADHVIPKSKGGMHGVSNRVLACKKCNLEKDNILIEDFLKHDPKRLQRILSKVKKPLSDAAAMNATRNKLLRTLESIKLPIFTSTGAQTKLNRDKLRIDKTHALDALCVGNVSRVRWSVRQTLCIKAEGRGLYARTVSDKYGFPRLYMTRIKRPFGFGTGDVVKDTRLTALTIANGIGGLFTKHTYLIGRVTIKANGYFKLLTQYGIKYIPHHRCQLVQRHGGYRYTSRHPSKIA